MSTYIEITMNERTDSNHTILTHRHMRIDGPRAIHVALALFANAADTANNLSCMTIFSKTFKPCSLCATMKSEPTHDLR